jgi:hypothetical protein
VPRPSCPCPPLRGGNILASGQGGSPTVTGDANSDGPLLTRNSFPGFSSKATNLVPGVGRTSVAYINTLVALGLSPNFVFSGSQPGTLVGYLSVTSLLAGQYLPPEYSLPGAEANNALFALGGTKQGDAHLLTQFLANSAGQQVYLIRVHVNVGFGDNVAFLQVAVMPTTGGGGGITARLVPVRLGRKKKASRLMVQVFAAGVEHDFLSPFQAPRFKNIRVSVVDANGDGVADEVVVTARKGRRHFTATFPA